MFFRLLVVDSFQWPFWTSTTSATSSQTKQRENILCLFVSESKKRLYIICFYWSEDLQALQFLLPFSFTQRGNSFSYSLCHYYIKTQEQWPHFLPISWILTWSRWRWVHCCSLFYLESAAWSEMTRLSLGIILFAFGLVGLLVKKEWYKAKRTSYTGHQLIWGTYILLIAGLLLIITSIIKIIAPSDWSDGAIKKVLNECSVLLLYLVKLAFSLFSWEYIVC